MHSQSAPSYAMQVSTTCQISMLLPLDPSDTALCVVNTHLFFHPKASHMRTLMTAAIVVEALHAIDAVVNEHSQAVRPALIFCGDFNSGLNHGMPGMQQHTWSTQKAASMSEAHAQMACSSMHDQAAIRHSTLGLTSI